MRRFLVGVALATLAMPASAAVRYDFQTFSSFEVRPDIGQVVGQFSFTAPDFLTANTIVPVGDLAGCSATASVAGALACHNQQFDVFGPGDPLLIRFGMIFPGVGAIPEGPGAIAYYFDFGAFTTVGVHDTVLFGADQAGRLTVTNLGGPAVPEPATWAMMIAGFGLIGGAMRRAATRSRLALA